MSKMPKVKIKSLLYGDNTEPELADLEKIKSHFATSTDTIVVVEGRVVNSYDELAKMIAQDQFKGKEALDVMLLPVIEGG